MAQTDGYGWFRPDPDGRTWRPVREKTPTTSADVSGDLQDGMLAYYRESSRVDRLYPVYVRVMGEGPKCLD